MKKVFTIVLFSVFLALVVSAQKPEGIVKAASVAPVLDGIPDAVWDEATVYNIELPFLNEFPSLGFPGDTYWKALWNDDGVYVLVNVTDDEFLPFWKDNPPGLDEWEYDMVELYFDCNEFLEDGLGCVGGDNEGHHQYAPQILETAINGELREDERGYSYATLVTGSNYVAEYFIPWEILVDRENYLVDRSGIVGFDVTVIDRETGDPARNRAVWSNIGIVEESWANMDDCGLITFEGAEPFILVESLSLTGGNISENNGKLQIQAEILPADVRTTKLNWSIENLTGRATIDSDGVVTGIVDGDVIVTAATTDGSDIESSALVTISNQIVTRPDLNLIRNGYFDEVTQGGTAAEWDGVHWVFGGEMFMDPPAGGINFWDHSVTQQNFGCNTTDQYTFSFVAWAVQSGILYVDFEDSNHDYNRYGTSNHPYAIDGKSEWAFLTNTAPTAYSFDVIFNDLQVDTRESCQFMAGFHDPVLYIDNVELINDNDLAFLTPDYIAVEYISVSGADGATSLGQGKTLQMSAAVLPAGATLKDVNWSVMPGTGDASIDASGLLSAVSVGTVMVYATAKDDSKVSGMLNITIVDCGLPGIIQIAASVTDEACPGASDASIDISVSGPTSPYTYLWSNGEDTEDLQNISSGSYALTVTDANKCMDSANFVVAQSLVDINFDTIDISPPVCSGDENGSIAISVSGSYAPFTYLWSNGSVSNEISNLPSGSYEVVVTDSKGCLESEIINISDPIPLVLADLISEPTCNGATNGNIKLDIAGGSEPYLISWFDDSTEDSVSGLGAGCYMVSVIDDVGCIEEKNICLSEPEALILSLSKRDNICFGDNNAMIYTDASGGIPGYEFIWSDQNAQDSNGMLTAGNYTITVFDAHDCSDVDSIEIVDPEKTTIGEILGVKSVDEFQTYTYSVAAQSNYLYHWNVEGGNIVSGQGNNLVDIQWGAEASGLIKTVAESDLGCYSDTASLSISIVSTGMTSMGAREFNVYPNPTLNALTVETNAKGEYTLQLCKLNGQLLMQKEISDPIYSLDLSSFARGIYFINIKSEDHVSTRKIVKL